MDSEYIDYYRFCLDLQSKILYRFSLDFHSAVTILNHILNIMLILMFYLSYGIPISKLIHSKQDVIEINNYGQKKSEEETMQ